MKYLTFIILLLPSYISACIIGPEKLDANEENDFVYSISSSDYCQNCNTIRITGPKQYKSHNFSHGLFTLYDQNKVLSKTIHSSVNDAGQPEFFGIINGNKNINYEITFEYGNGRCMSYTFIYKNNNGT